ncbi:MAG: stage 0 sporulation family protein [Dehalococcoidia bacterium]|jgi:cell fate regulator YaaT (PSP1 superfamily)
MAEIVGIRFKRAGRVYYFDPAGIEMKLDDFVVVKTARGSELGWVVIAPSQVEDSEVSEPLKPVLRQAEAEDIERLQEFEAKEDDALAECGRLIDKLELPMKLLGVEYNLDGSRLTFFFSATERVDFRALVRELNKRFKVRVELRQLGPRDEAKLVGGFGRCGRPLCCTSFLTEFSPVSIKMAKEQNLPLNPLKISGVCGRLLCCLAYETDQYHAMKEKMPKPGQRVSTPMGPANVVTGNPLKETVLLELESKAMVEMPLSDVKLEKQSPRSEKHSPQSKKS